MPESIMPKELSDLPPEMRILHFVNNSCASLNILKNFDSNIPADEDINEAKLSLGDKIRRLRQIDNIPVPELQQRVAEFCELVKKFIIQPNQNDFEIIVKVVGDINSIIAGRG